MICWGITVLFLWGRHGGKQPPVLSIMSIIQLLYTIFKPHEINYFEKQMNSECSCQFGHKSVPQILAIKTSAVKLTDQRRQQVVFVNRKALKLKINSYKTTQNANNEMFILVQKFLEEFSVYIIFSAFQNYHPIISSGYLHLTILYHNVCFKDISNYKHKVKSKVS